MNTKTFINNVFATGMLLTCLVGWDVQHSKVNIEIHAEAPKEAVEVTTVAQEIPNDVEGYIKYVFGEDFDKAMLLLKGNGAGTCAENRNLDPEAINDNTLWGGVGRDVSIFQVNDVFHPVVELNLEHDWKANVDYAKRMFDNDGRTFSKRWTCGKWYKSLGYNI